MKSRRTLALLAASALAAGGVAVTGDTSATATRDHVQTVVPAGHGVHSIEGRVVDQRGRLVQDAEVELFRRTNDSGTPNASALTYPGYFKFTRLTRGKYSLAVGKKGYEPLTLKKIAVGPGNPHVKLGKIVLMRRLVSTTAKLVLPHKALRAGEKVKLLVKVASKKKAPDGLVGKVGLVLDKLTRGTERLKKSDKGRATFKLGKLSPGKHSFKVSFAGSPYLAASKDKGKFEVKPKRRH